MPKPDNNAAIAFLRQWSAHGPWILTAIDLDKKGISTSTFTSDEEDELLEWLDAYNGVRNCYFHVNPATRPLKKKANREDIAALAWLHVDIDPRVGEELEKEQQRALESLREPPGDVPPPTAVIFSGGGYQGFWRLSDPFQIDGDMDLAEEAKRWNLQLEIIFGADNCHNVDRIMRLPGTINLPDAKKKRKGRKPALASVVEFHPEREYSLDQFNKAPEVQDVKQKGGSFTASINLRTGNIERLGSIDEIDKYAAHEISERCKICIVQGEDPESTSQESRSDTLWYVVCELVRCGVPDEWVYSIITDPELRISESVLDKGRRTERYALRQISRAREFAIDPKLLEMNERHAVIGNLGGRCMVMEELHDYALNRPQLTVQSFSAIRNRYNNQPVVVGEKKGKPQTKPLGEWWLKHEKRRQYETIVFAPGKEVHGSYNLWKGFACEAVPGDCSLFLEHVRDNICNGNKDHYQYVLGWMARAVQRPAEPGAAAIVMRGRQGTGKSFFAKAFGSLWGRHFLQVSNPKHVVGHFNSHLRDCVVLFGDEAFAAGRKEHENTLKTLITEETLAIEQKGHDVIVSPNYLHLILASNSNWVVPANVDERRFFVLDVASHKMQNSAYFGAIQEQLSNSGYKALLYTLMNHDISGHSPYRIPQTKALQEQKILSFQSEEEWWYNKLVHGQIIEGNDNWQASTRKDKLIEDYLKYTQQLGVSQRASATALGKFLKRACPMEWPRSRRRLIHTQNERGEATSERYYFWEFPTLAECREHWDKKFGGPYEWPEDDTVEDDAIPF